MRKALAFYTLIAFIHTINAQNSVTLYLYDSYGDGWNGGVINVAGTNYTLESGAEASFVLDLPDGSYDWYYYAGSWAYENSWSAYDDAVNLLFSGSGDDGNQGGVFTVPFVEMVTIHDIQFVEDPETNDASPLEGDVVTTQGMVTGVAYNGYYLQDASGPWNGVWVYDPGRVAGNILISEYYEGESYNRYLELFNPTDEDIDLTGFFVGICSNAHSDGDNPENLYETAFPFPDGDMIYAKDTYVITRDNADPAIVEMGDWVTTESGPSNFNGNDWIGIYNGASVLLDAFGVTPSATNPDYFDVAGVTGAARNHLIYRDVSVLGGNDGYWDGGTYEDSEWIVVELAATVADDIVDLGHHYVNLPELDDLIMIEGTVVEYYGETQIQDVTAYEWLSYGWIDPVWVVWTEGLSDESLEGVYVWVSGEATTEANDYGEWTIDDGSGPAIIDDQLFDGFSPNLGWWYDVIGPVDNSYSANKVQPVNEDYIFATPPCEANDVMISCDLGSWQSEVSWELLDYLGDTVATGGAPYYNDHCLDDGAYTLYMHDSYGDGWNGNMWEVYDYDTEAVLVSVTLETGAEGSYYFTIGETTDVFGCTDMDAFNYNEDATVDDGSCYYAGDSCAVAIAAVAGDAGNQADGGDEYFSFTASMNGFMTITTCYPGQMEDSNIQLWSACPDDGGALLADNDDAFCTDITGGNNYASEIADYPITAGETFIIFMDDYWAPGPFVWYLYESPPPSAPENLTAEAGLEMVSLTWEPLPPSGGRGNFQAGTGDDLVSNIQDDYEASLVKKSTVDNNSSEKKIVSRERLIEAAAQPRKMPYRYHQVLQAQEESRNNRDATVMVSFYDSYGDGYDGDAWITNEDTQTEVAYFPAAGFNGDSIHYGPYDLVDGLYSMNVTDASWASETTWLVTDATSGEVYASGTVPTVTYFTIGEGTTPQADLSFNDLWYDHDADAIAVEVVNSGDVDAAGFYVTYHLGSEADPECGNTNYVTYSYVTGLAAGDTVTTATSAGVLAYVGGYGTHIFGALADYLCAIDESNETNNTITETLDILNPLDGVVWNVYRQEVEYALPFVFLDSTVTDPWYTDMAVTGGFEYCYYVTQELDAAGTESDTSNHACAIPAGSTELPVPQNVTGSSDGWDVTITWDHPDLTDFDPMIGQVIPIDEEKVDDPSSYHIYDQSAYPDRTRQGGDTVDDATVIDELPYYNTGTTEGYTDDYDEVCPYSGSTSPDVVYSLTPATDMLVEISLCGEGTYYDTKVYVYEGEAGTLAMTVNGLDACNDDFCQNSHTNWLSYLSGVMLTGGTTYYIVVDGYGGDQGVYEIEIVPEIPPSPIFGYGVYRDSVMVGSTPGPDDMEDAVYNDFITIEGDHDYYVTAWYDTYGESGPSNTVTVTVDAPGPNLYPPENLTADAMGNDVLLWWDAPPGGPGWLTHSNGDFGTTIGTGGDMDAIVAQQFGPEQLFDYNGMYMTDIEFIPAEAIATYQPVIFEVPIGVLPDSSHVVSSGPVLSGANLVMVEYNIAPVSAHQIDWTMELWVGIHIVTTGGFPAGTDTGPMVPGGGKILWGGVWYDLTTLNASLDYNWALGGFVDYNPTPVNVMANPGFEETVDAGNGWQLYAADWIWWPGDAQNHHVDADGNNIYGSNATFDTWNGMYGLKMWGAYTGTVNNTSYYQSFTAEELGGAGTEVMADGMFMSHADDWIGQGTNTTTLFVSYFDANWAFIGMHDSEFSGEDAPNVWHHRHVDGLIPDGAVNVFIGIQYNQMDNDQHGSVYMDDVTAHVAPSQDQLLAGYDLALDGQDISFTFPTGDGAGFHDHSPELKHTGVVLPPTHTDGGRDMLLHYNVWDYDSVVAMVPMDQAWIELWDEEWGDHEYRVTAVYEEGESEPSNMVYVNLSNNPPAAFQLIAPTDDSWFTIDASNMDNQVAFIWTASGDADGDIIDYTITIGDEIGGGGDTSLSVTHLFIDYSEFADYQIEQNAGVVEYTWTVIANDGYEATEASGGPRSFTVDVSSLIVPSDTTYLGISYSNGFPGDTVTVSVWAELGFDMYSFEMAIGGYEGSPLTFLDVDTMNTMIPSGWLLEYSEDVTDGIIITAGAGAESVTGNGDLFHLAFIVDSEIGENEWIELFIDGVAFNENESLITITEVGGIMILEYGDVSGNGSVTAFDASLILQYLIGDIELNEEQMSAGDVTQDGSLSALDASIVLQYVVGTIDDLPYDGGINLAAGGEILIPNGSATPGELFQMPILLEQGNNVRSIEMEISYDPDVLSYHSVSWNESLTGLTLMDSHNGGVIKVSAAGADAMEPGSITLGWIEFELMETFEDYQTTITLSQSRLNENEILTDGSSGVYTNALLVVDEWGHGGVPEVYALGQNFPNPFNPSTLIRYQLPQEAKVTINIYDMMGRTVRNLVRSETQIAGYRQVIWNATNDLEQPVSAGVYLYVIRAGEFKDAKKMVLMK